jgi:plastocyanin
MTRSRTRLLGASAAVCLLTVLSGCSSTDKPADSTSSGSSRSTQSPPSSGPSKAAASHGDSSASAAITIKDYKYSGDTTVAPGAEVTVTNDDSEAHTVTADSGSAFDVKVDPGASATFTAPSKPGTYAYHCTYHSNMHGTLRVG